jgi:RNA recognition motif-containing protein
VNVIISQNYDLLFYKLAYIYLQVIRNNTDNKARGYGFVSFIDPMDCAKAIREQNGKYLLTRPMKITKSNWKERDIKEVKKKETKKRKMYESLGLA